MHLSDNATMKVVKKHACNATYIGAIETVDCHLHITLYFNCVHNVVISWATNRGISIVKSN